MARRHELSDDQWNAIQALIPGKAGDPGRSGRNNRLFVNAVLFVRKTGIPWDDLPERYGKPTPCGNDSTGGVPRGVWQRVFQAIGSRRGTGGTADRFHKHQGSPGVLDGSAQAGQKMRTPTTAAAWAAPEAD